MEDAYFSGSVAEQRADFLRNLRERAKFRIQETITRSFRDFLYSQNFTEIHTPKIGARGAEGGANIFKLDYFHHPAVLAQSPQFYKQMMVGVFDRVFETGPVFRAEKHNTKRHLNEYTSLDFEMGYIDSFTEIMEMETGFLRYMTEELKKRCEKELKMLEVDLPDVRKFPVFRLQKQRNLSVRLTAADPQPLRSGAGGRGTDRKVFQRRLRCGFCFCHTLSVKEASVLRDG